MKKEVEVKIKVEDFSALKANLINLGCMLSEPIVQEDTIFINYDRPFIEFKMGDIFLRIRKAKGKTIFTLKQGEEMNSLERETEVANAEQLYDILKILGFRPEVTVKKTRQKTKYKDYEICLDEVENLGTYVEVEKITDEDAARAQREMIDFLKSLGVQDDTRVMNGYDTLMWLKNNPDYKK